jgi:hypothetical protein
MSPRFKESIVAFSRRRIILPAILFMATTQSHSQSTTLFVSNSKGGSNDNSSVGYRFERGMSAMMMRYENVTERTVGNAISVKATTLRLTVRDGSKNGTAVNSETLTVTTNPFESAGRQSKCKYSSFS